MKVMVTERHIVDTDIPNDVENLYEAMRERLEDGRILLDDISFLDWVFEPLEE